MNSPHSSCFSRKGAGVTDVEHGSSWKEENWEALGKEGERDIIIFNLEMYKINLKFLKRKNRRRYIL